MPDHVVGPDGEPPIPGSLGMLSSAPMEAFRVRLVGREMNLFDRVGVTIDPVYADYTDGASGRGLALAVLRDHGLAVVAREAGYPGRTFGRRLTNIGASTR